MSRTSLVDRAYLRNQNTPAAAIPYARYDAMVNQAMSLLAQEVAANQSQLLQKDFSVTISSGLGSLTTSLTASEPMLLLSAPLAPISDITSSDATQPWQYLPGLDQIYLDRPTFGMVFYTVNGSDLIATDTTGALSSLSTTAVCHTYFVPLPASLSGTPQLEEWGIKSLADLVGGSNAIPAAA